MPNNHDAMRERAKKYLRDNGIVWHVESRTPDIVADFAARESADLAARLKTAEQENERLRNALSLRECVACGVCNFEISPVNPSEGFCWNCHHHRMVISPGSALAHEQEGK